jgi:RNA polymerase sigma factor (sigma-70 family)
MNNDELLLRAYAVGKSERAFAELVNRHVGLVYAVALRRVGYDSHLAEDVVQVVFSALARKANSLVGRQTLSGWLYVSAHASSAEVVRKERRRKRREDSSFIIQEIQNSGKPAPEWERIRPLLDDLIVKLERVDQEAIILRFFEKRSFAEIGASLQLTEDTARKRVERALGKLRSTLTKSGFASSAATLSESFAGELASAPPTGLAAKVATTAVSEFATAAVGTSLVMAILNAVQPALVTVVGIGLALGTLLTWQYRSITALRSEIAARETQESEVHFLRAENERNAGALALAHNASLSKKSAKVKVPEAGPPTDSTGMPATDHVPVSVVWVTPEGRILWNGNPVTLAEFLEQLKSYREGDPDPNGNIVILGQTGTPFSAFAYAVEQASKADIKNIILSTPPSPTTSDLGWLTPKAPLSGGLERLAPSLPDSPIKN